MVDEREEILLRELGIENPLFASENKSEKEKVLNAMDENGKQMCLDLLEYMAKKQVKCGVFPDGHTEFIVKADVNWDILTKEQLFENFL